MTATPQTTEYTIDAKGKRLGAVAAEAAAVLLGKHSPAFAKHTVFPVLVTITNARLIDVSERKRTQEVYKTYSGYPGGQRVETLGHLANRRGMSEALTRTIAGMLPRNKLHKLRMQNLVVND